MKKYIYKMNINDVDYQFISNIIDFRIDSNYTTVT